MRHGSRIVNIAHGKLIDEEALVSALESRQLFAAGLDDCDEAECKPQISEDEERGAVVSYGRYDSGKSRWFQKVRDREYFELLESGKAITAVNAHLVNKSRP